MKKIIFICLVLITSFLNAQNLKFKNFKIADYEITSDGIVEISTHSTVDKKGNIIVYSDSWDGKNFFEYKLSNSEIEKLNSLTERDLEKFVKQKKLNENQFFAGKRKFITFDYKGKNRSLCFIEPFMNEEFAEILKLLGKNIYGHDENAKIPMMSTDFEKTKKDIINREKVDNYLPQKAIIRQIK
ncbi:hypothetical protein ASG31_16380 [Chryseobacterium sp. Leaf404]|uniref:hypothetical protein n=1 Tax=unclassified Chryseobacterium TaxID=2593645 RepID=UPI0006F9CE90|nr:MULTISPECIES: hypothetical protein [unclassified Chryseobacterium]KQT21451.1 hypothetical protein ASG31_16380 [Chryseobacterium sp. Leaf404]